MQSICNVLCKKHPTKQEKEKEKETQNFFLCLFEKNMMFTILRSSINVLAMPVALVTTIWINKRWSNRAAANESSSMALANHVDTSMILRIGLFIKAMCTIF